MRIIETKVYKIDEHPNPEKCFDWIRNNWHDLGEHCLEEAVGSIKALADHCGVKPDWSISISGHRGEYVRFDGHDLDAPKSDVDIDLSGSFPLTGVCYDETLLDAFRDDSNVSLDDALRDAGERIIQAMHNEGEYLYSDEALREMCELNEYEFTECGGFYS